jgi:DNA-binding MarR family transcriptional regulator
VKGNESTLPQALGRLRVALEDSFLRTSRQLGLTPQQAELLCAAIEPAAVGDLAERLRCDRSNVSRLLDRAAARGLVRRRGSEDDGRVTVVELTPIGDVLARRFLAALESQTEALGSRWSGEHRHFAVEALNELSDTLDISKQLTPRRRRAHKGQAGQIENAESAMSGLKPLRDLS